MKHLKALLGHRSMMLAFYDFLVQMFSCLLIMGLRVSIPTTYSPMHAIFHALALSCCIIASYTIGKVYHQVWRYSRVDSYIRLILCNILGGVAYVIVSRLFSPLIPGMENISLIHAISIVLLGLFGCIVIRFGYVWMYEMAGKNRIHNVFLKKVVSALISLPQDEVKSKSNDNRIRIAIVGAGRVGAILAEELATNPDAAYTPVCFVDIDRGKIGRDIAGVPVFAENEHLSRNLVEKGVQEIVVAIPKASGKQKELYERYKALGYNLKFYAFPIENTEKTGKRQIREFSIEELLFRQEVNFVNDQTAAFYKDRVVLISGGGGSIGSELARQIAKMQPRQLILLDIYENSVYDIQQEMKLIYGDSLNLSVEIGSVRDRAQLEKIFRIYHPEIVLHAAAHKHVPLMEHNCSEAVKNNIFGTLNMVLVSEKYGVSKFIMISTDKAVNPTNIMGATKRFCEMMVLSRAAISQTSFSCTRFGNVLGSNGSVIPLFKRQIANGGPITLTDRRIIRYFMTIPEASQLVLTSGAMAENGELFVLDMGRPVKILDLAENMIRLSGLVPNKDIAIVETGLRPGEKLFEELLIKTEKMKKTDNDMIFIEIDESVAWSTIEEKLEQLRKALESEDEEVIRKTMKSIVPTYHSPNHVNRDALADGRYKQEAEGTQRSIAG